MGDNDSQNLNGISEKKIFSNDARESFTYHCRATAGCGGTFVVKVIGNRFIPLVVAGGAAGSKHSITQGQSHGTIRGNNQK